MKALIYIAVILAVLILLGITWGKSVFNRITFSDPQLAQFSLSELQNIASGKITTIPVSITISNANNFSISFSKISIALSFNGTVFALTADPSGYTIPANGNLTITENIIFSLNDAAIELLAEKIQGKPAQIQYTIGLRIFGIPIPSINNTFNW